MQKTVTKLEEENESLMSQLNKERTGFMDQLKGVEAQLEKATSDNEHLTLCLRRADDQLAKATQGEQELASQAVSVEQTATKEAIAMCEAAEADNDRLLEEVEHLQQQLRENQEQGAAEGARLEQFMHELVAESAPMRHTMAELIFGILEDFVEEEEESEKSPVVEDLEKTCQLMSQMPAPVEGASPLAFVCNDYRHLIKSFNAFRELLVAATTMATEAVTQINQDAGVAAENKAQACASAEAQKRIKELEGQMAEMEEKYTAAKEAAKTARHDVAEVRNQIRRCKNDSESSIKKAKEAETNNTQLIKDLKHVKGQLEQVKKQKHEAFNKARKVQNDRAAHEREIESLKSSSDQIRKEMEFRMLSSCKEQEEYANVMCELRSKLERELMTLQQEHQLAEENNAALMEDRVNLIAQLTETKIEAQETLQRTVEEYEAKASEGSDATRVEDLERKLVASGKLMEQEQGEAEAHRQTCEKYRIDLEATLKRVGEMADEISRLEAEAAECEELRDVLSKQKQEFDRELAELQLTVDRMEQSAATREAAMAERAEEALEKAIEHARTEAHKQSEEAIAKAIHDAQFQNSLLHGDAEDKLHQACEHIQRLEAKNAELTRDKYELGSKLDHCRQQVVDGRQRVVQAEEMMVQQRAEAIRPTASADDGSTRRFGSVSQKVSPAKEQHGSMSWLKRMRKENAKGDKENTETCRQTAGPLALTAKKDKSSMKGKLQQFARGVTPMAESTNKSPSLSKVQAPSISVSQDCGSPGARQVRENAKAERMATLARLKQRS